MIKKSFVKDAFELLSRSMSTCTPLGVYTAKRCEIKIISVGSKFSVALYKVFVLRNGTEHSCCACHSYPMSYKSAHRLACSL